ncbi:unnamed protein product [Phytophthora fragariaefolia]|uniref:Unnamed protein product n=1 Tax=Phytophthora fragariaefolia TaxID=1490495 RepID=A0A9W6Y8W5_9STRA|nr:unnamed protein product [Phytophthora fragariaefolia]
MKSSLQRSSSGVGPIDRLGHGAAARRAAAPPKRTRRAAGAKLKQQQVDEQESDDEASSEQSAGEEEEEEEHGAERKRVKRGAVDAYSQLPPSWKPSSVRVSSADDLLSSMDDIIKAEEEADEAAQRGHADAPTFKLEPARPKPPQSARTRKTTAVETEPSPPPKPQPVEQTRATSTVDEAMDSEEEDILDMLS